MKLLRRLLGASDETYGGRRTAHVTRSDGYEPPPEASPEIAPVARAESHSAPEPEAAASEPPAPKPLVSQQPPKPKPAARAAPPAPAPASKAAAPKRGMSWGMTTSVGMQRSNNEDACFALGWRALTIADQPDFGLFAVADGMGGHLDGEKAAGIAVQVMASEMLGSAGAALLRGAGAASGGSVLEAMANAAEIANQSVIQRVPGGGTTLSAVAVVGDLAYVAHVGDSRVYLIGGDGIEQLTTDHTLVQRLIEMNELTPAEAERYPQKNVLYRAIGQDEALKVERLVRNLRSGSRLLICSDGLWDLVDDESIRRVAAEAPKPQQACDRLVALANERGGNDNISVIVVAMAD